jgi:hypothetical protein
VEKEQEPIRRSGGKILAYFLPTDYAGPANEALELIEFPSLQAYETYRDRLARDDEHRKNVARLESSGANVRMERSIIQRVASNGQADKSPATASAACAGSTPVERMYLRWDAALSRNDAEELLSLYGKDAHFESPLVCHLLKRDSGVLRGHDELRPLFEMLRHRKPKVRQYHRKGYLTDGKRLFW